MKQRCKGFSLIEMLFVVAILGILLAIAIPLYNNYRANAYRSAAKTALVEGAQLMERLFTRSAGGSYTGATIADPPGPDQIRQWTESRKYQLTFQDPTTPANPGPPTDDAYVIRATPVFSDRCGWLQIDHLGNRTSEIGTNCW